MIAGGRGQQAAALLALPRHCAWLTTLTPHDESTTTQELHMLAWARVCIVRNEHAQALPVLQAWVAHTRKRHCVRSALRISAVLAALHVSRDETAAAGRVIRAALQMTGELLRMSAQGMATSDLATALGLTQSTVKWYWQRIFAKLEVHRRFEAVTLARGRGWIG